MKITRDKFIELYNTKEVDSIQFKDKEKIISILHTYYVIGDDEFGEDILEKNDKITFRIYVYYNNVWGEQVYDGYDPNIEEEKNNLDEIIEKLDKYKIFDDNYGGKMTTNWTDPDEIQEPDPDENGMLITKEEILKILKIDDAAFSFKKDNEEIGIDNWYGEDEKTGDIDMNVHQFIISNYTNYDIPELFINEIEEVFKVLEKMNILVDDKAYVYTINGRNPKKFIDIVRNK